MEGNKIVFKSEAEARKAMKQVNPSYAWKHADEVVSMAMKHSGETIKDWYFLEECLSRDLSFYRWSKEFLNAPLFSDDKINEEHFEEYCFVCSLLRLIDK